MKPMVRPRSISTRLVRETPGCRVDFIFAPYSDLVSRAQRVSAADPGPRFTLLAKIPGSRIFGALRAPRPGHMWHHSSLRRHAEILDDPAPLVGVLAGERTERVGRRARDLDRDVVHALLDLGQEENAADL